MVGRYLVVGVHSAIDESLPFATQEMTPEYKKPQPTNRGDTSRKLPNAMHKLGKAWES